MANSYAILKAQEIRRLVEILRMTIDRRFWADSVIEAAVENIDMECAMLISTLKKDKGD